MSGVLRALLGVVDALESIEGKNDRTEHYRAAVGHVASLLRILPPGHELASALASEHARLRQVEGNTARVERLREAYREIEERLDACFSLSLSEEPRAVDTAESILNQVVSQIGDPTLVVRRGDVMGMSYLGATVLATYPNGMKLELDLRKAHQTIDVDCYVPGYWVVEGAVSSLADESIMKCQVEESIGSMLPRGIDTRIKAHLRALIAGCASSVVTLVPNRMGEGEESTRMNARR